MSDAIANVELARAAANSPTPAPIDLEALAKLGPLTDFEQGMLNIQRAIRHRSWDALALFTGKPGKGKSTLGYKCCRYVDPGFNVKRVAYTLEDLFGMIEDCNPGDAFLYDEAGQEGYALDFATTHGKDFAKLGMVMREMNAFIGMCLPRKKDLLEFFREGRMTFWAHVVRRGYAQFYVPEENRFNGGTWWMPEFPFEFVEETGDDWGEYKKRKKAYARGKVSGFAQKRRDANADPDAPRQNREAYLREVASSIAQEPTMFDKRGRADRGKIALKYPDLNNTEVGKVAGLARAARVA